jgi:hypothetical protein
MAIILTYSRGDHSLIMVRVYTNTVLFQIKSILTIFDMLQFIFMQIWPSPYSSINDMREAFPTSYL